MVETGTDEIDIVQLADGRVDMRTGRVYRKTAKPVSLTTMERRALAWLVQHTDREVSHEELLMKVWDYAPGVQSRAPYFTVRRLRSKLEVDLGQPRHLQTVHGHGYRFVGLAATAPKTEQRSLPGKSRGNLPVFRPRLFGREEELEALREVPRPGRWLGLYGPPGVGKTALALALAAATDCSEAWWCEMNHIQDLPQAARAIAQMLGRQPSDGDTIEPLHAVASMLEARGSVVLVLDDASPLIAAELAQEWVPQIPGLRLIGTHNTRPSAPDVHLVRPLEPAAGAALLRHSAAGLGCRLAESDEEALRALSGRLDGLPLALELLAPRLGLAAPERLARRGHGPTVNVLRDSIDGAWSKTRKTPRAVLQACAAFPGGATLDDLIVVAIEDEHRVLDALQDLTDRCLVQVVDEPTGVSEPRFAVLAAVRAYVSGQPQQESVVERQRERTARYAWDLCLQIDDGSADSHRRLALEYANLESALQRQDSEVPARLALDRLLQSGGTPEERWINADRAVQLAREQGDPIWIAEALLVRASTVRGTPRSTPTDLTEAAELSESVELTTRIALASGQAHLAHGRPKDAVPHLDAARASAEQTGRPALVHSVLQACLHSALDQSDFTTARGLVESIAALRHAYGLDHLPHRNVAIWYSKIGDRDAMVDTLRKDLVLYQMNGDRESEANAKMNIGHCQMQEMDADTSRTLREAAELARQAGNRQIESLARYNLAMFLFIEDRGQEAVTEAMAALTLSRDIGHLRQEASTELGLGQITAATDSARAHTHLTRSTLLADECGDPYIRICAQILHASVLEERGDSTAANATWEAARSWIEASPLADQMLNHLRYHRALLELVRGDPKPVEIIFEEDEDSPLKRCLQIWASSRMT